MKMTQLSFPGLEEKVTLLFPKEKCNLAGCSEPARFLAIYFIMGNYNEDDDQPSLVGYDCPFEDSPPLYACGESHLEQQIKLNYNGKGEVDEMQTPNIIVNPLGSIEVELYDQILGRLGETLYSDFLTKKLYSHHRESLEELWKRESWRWI